MSGSPYASSLGRLQSQFPSFLPKEAYTALAAAKDVGDLAKVLEATAYGPEILQSAASVKGAPLLEIAINRTFVRRNRQALDATPFAGKGFDDTPAPILGGLIAVTSDGSRRLNLSFDELLRLREDQVRTLLAP